jgi:hypothetical protein
MVKKIYLEHSLLNQMNHTLGKFLDHDCYDLVLTEDADVYEPLTPLQILMGEEHSEKNLLCKFRKNVFPKEMTDAAYTHLRSGAMMSDNRGLAAGVERDTAFQKLPDGEGSRRWVTEREKAVLQYLAQGSPRSIDDRDMLRDIYNNTPNTPLQGRGAGGNKELGSVRAGAIWIVNKTVDFDFDKWVVGLFNKDASERRQAAHHVLFDMISDTTYANGVRSGVGGFMDRYPRIPFCRETGWSAGNKDKYQESIALFEAANEVFKREVPNRWAGQAEAMEQLGEDWRIGNTVYTTLTINRDFRTAAHRDVGDLCESYETANNPRGFSNLLVLDNGKHYNGFYLCFPEFGVAADIRAGDMIMMNAHRIHSNSPAFDYEEGFERMSVVMYFRESMLSCGSRKYEECRREYVYMRRDSKEHPDRPKNEQGVLSDSWNGVSPSMWDTEEWANYLGHNGFSEEANAVLNSLRLTERF